ncbi:MAG: C45 family peptidase [Planctomycetota bacterium]
MPPTPEDAGFAHGRHLAPLLDDIHAEFMRRFCTLKRLTLDAMRTQSLAWLDDLPTHIQEEIAAMATGADRPLADIADFLYADIATPGDPSIADGPMCSAVVSRLHNHSWVARNTDWYPPLLLRGCEAVVHNTPNRIPTLALGIRGDIDVDTGCNAEGLWLHAHTMHAKRLPPSDKPRISWLFWLREALETCAKLDDLERKLTEVERDRGIILVALDSTTNDSAVFECTVDTHERINPTGDHLLATNHPANRHPTDPARLARSQPSSTTRRLQALRDICTNHPPEHAPDDLIDTLAHETVEMRTPPVLRTIYSTVCNPRTGKCWFASGTPEGQPAASTGEWLRVPWPF